MVVKKAFDPVVQPELLATPVDILDAPIRDMQRWQVETAKGMLKRLLGTAFRGRRYWNPCREILLRPITLKTMIRRRRGVFY